MLAMKKLSIVIPAFNEAATLRQLVEKLLTINYGVDYEVLIVDDHSSDQTHAIAKALSLEPSKHVKIFRNEINQGKGYSIQKGFERATGDMVIVQDADSEYDPCDIPQMLQPILRGEADMVFGSRFLKKWHPSGMAYPNMIANRLLTVITNGLFGTRLTDVYSCYKLIPLTLLKENPIQRNGFESEAEILANVLRKKLRVCETPISYHGRTAQEGKKIKARDFFMAIEVLLKNRN